MKKNLALLLSVFALCSLTACESESHSSSETNIEFSTTSETEEVAEAEVTEPETSEVEPQEVADSDIDTDTDTEGKYDSDIYDIQYYVNEDGNIVIYVPETDDDYWRQITIDETEITMDLVADEIDEEGIYYVELKPTIEDGIAQAILGHFTLESDEEAVEFAVLDISVEDGKVTAVVNSGFTANLEDIL